MPYLIYLPPGYGPSGPRYPTLYMLHGNSGHYEEWAAYGLIDWADAMIERGEIQPLVIVLPQGDYGYWVNLVDDGPAYGDYLSTDLVRHVNATYRVLQGPEYRAIGGLSMGATGALIHAFTEPNRFAVVGAHSPSLPAEGERTFLGSDEEFARRSPIDLAASEIWLDELSIWIDVGDEDAWLDRVDELHEALTERHVEHEWHVLPGDHWGGYWAEHIPDYLRFYDAALHAERG
jgi:enterochelin esterase-like enzyme